MRKGIIFTILLFTIVFSISVVSASENITDDSISIENDNTPIEKIDSEDVLSDDKIYTTIEAKASGDKIKVEVKDPDYYDSNLVVDRLYYQFDNSTKKISSNYEDYENGATYIIPHNLEIGHHTVTLSILDSVYESDLITLEFNVAKKTPTVKAIKCTTTNKYVTLKATVKT